MEKEAVKEAKKGIGEKGEEARPEEKEAMDQKHSEKKEAESKTGEEPEKEPKEKEEEEVVTHKPWTRWTREERVEYSRIRRHTTGQRAFVTALFIILVFLTLAGMFYSITYQMDPAIIISAIAAFVIVIVAAAFFMPHICYRTE